MLVRFSRGMAGRSVIAGISRPLTGRSGMPCLATVSYGNRGRHPLSCEIEIAAEADFVRHRIKKFDKLRRWGDTHKERLEILKIDYVDAPIF
jgi:hypothetical protein